MDEVYLRRHMQGIMVNRHTLRRRVFAVVTCRRERSSRTSTAPAVPLPAVGDKPCYLSRVTEQQVETKTGQYVGLSVVYCDRDYRFHLYLVQKRNDWRDG